MPEAAVGFPGMFSDAAVLLLCASAFQSTLLEIRTAAALHTQDTHTLGREEMREK